MSQIVNYFIYRTIIFCDINILLYESDDIRAIFYIELSRSNIKLTKIDIILYLHKNVIYINTKTLSHIRIF